MNRDEIKAMWIAKGKEPNSVCNTDTICEFAEHIAKLEAEKEREACAQIGEAFDKERPQSNYGRCIAVAIRARGNGGIQ